MRFAVDAHAIGRHLTGNEVYVRSLLNALAQEVRGAVGPVPTTASASEFLLDQDGRPSVMLVDMPGVDGSAAVTEELLQQAERADLVLWVAAATQAARANDRTALDALRARGAAQVARRPAPILLALTHVDQLRPIHNLDSMAELVRALSADGGRSGNPKAWLEKAA